MLAGDRADPSIDGVRRNFDRMSADPAYEVVVKPSALSTAPVYRLPVGVDDDVDLPRLRKGLQRPVHRGQADDLPGGSQQVVDLLG